MRRLPLGIALFLGGRRAYRFYASGAVTIDSGIGRRVRGPGPVTWKIASDRETVFQVIAGPYLEKTLRRISRARCWQRWPSCATDMRSRTGSTS